MSLVSSTLLEPFLSFKKVSLLYLVSYDAEEHINKLRILAEQWNGDSARAPAAMPSRKKLQHGAVRSPGAIEKTALSIPGQQCQSV